MSAQRATPRVVIEYEFLGYSPPDDAEAFYVDAVVTHTDLPQLVGGNLMFVRQELAERVRAWASLLDQRGVTVKIERTDQGFVLEEYGCPYHNVAVENRAVCEMERQVMARLLESGVKLTRCVLDGHHGCQFTILEEKDEIRS